MEEQRAFWNRQFAFSAALAACGGAALLALAWAGWPGKPSACLTRFDCYCEAVHGLPLRQPVNALSSLALVVAGLAVAAEAARERETAAARLGPLFANTLIVLGLASTAFHGSLVVWAAIADAVSIFAVLGLLLASVLVRGGALGGGSAWLVLAGSVAAGAAYRLLLAPIVAPAALLPAVAVIVLENRVGREGHTREPRFLRWAMTLFALLVPLWLLSARHGFPLCLPESALQGHALFHAGAAAALYLLWRHASANPGRSGA